MSLTDNGGPAFPLAAPGPNESHLFHSGMTLRDWFAGQALAGFCATLHGAENIKFAALAYDAYAAADAMLKARKAT